MRAALYARVSTSEQSPEAQVEALREYARARGWEAQEHVDHGESGKKDRRPALDALMADVRARRVDVVAVVKLDRLARSVRHLCELAAELEALGVGLVVLDQAIDTTTPAGRFLFHTLAAVAELEHALISERTAAGRARAKRRGVRFGRRPVLDGLDVERAKRMRASGASFGEIARLFGVSKATAHGYVTGSVAPATVKSRK